jgi:diguanylate cyclase (GGDEF)-like protein
VADAELSGHLGDGDLNAVVATLRLACGVPMAVVNVVTANRQTYPAELGVGAPCTLVPDGLSFCAEVVDTGRAMSVSDAATHPVYSQNPMVLDGVVGAYAGVPLVDNGVVLGSVSIFDSQAREFTGDELEVLRHQAQLASSVLALRRSARTDILTGLPNRALYLDRLGRALGRLERHGGHVTVMYLDVDGFKRINDTLGHDVGDRVLVELARRLTAVMRPTDTLARFGGDEFVAVCEDVTSRRDAGLLAARMIGATKGTWIVDAHTLSVTVSIGVSLADSPAADPAALLRDADAAMYRVKNLAGAGWEVATSGDQTQHRSA